jgi:23S rRNA (cytosine1962-C5)-methyltransferase
LNLFAYTCGAGLVSALAGAQEVWNVDFSSGALRVGAHNAALNGIAVGDEFRLIREDVFAVVRQCAGLSIGGRPSRRRRQPLALARRSFDLVVLDPPRWAKSAFGTVDVIRDYESLFKPAAMATSPGGVVLATNHVAAVNPNDWTAALVRCADKAGRSVRSIELVTPEVDFPSRDGCPPTKIAWLVID